MMQIPFYFPFFMYFGGQWCIGIPSAPFKVFEKRLQKWNIA